MILNTETNTGLAYTSELIIKVPVIDWLSDPSITLSIQVAFTRYCPCTQNINESFSEHQNVETVVFTITPRQ